MFINYRKPTLYLFIKVKFSEFSEYSQLFRTIILYYIVKNKKTFHINHIYLINDVFYNK